MPEMKDEKESAHHTEKGEAHHKQVDEGGETNLFVGSRRALYGGIIAGAVALAGQWLLGSIYSGYEARQFLESMSSSALYFGSAIVTAAATILALMLTILSLTSQTDDDFDKVFYLRVERIGKLATVALMGGIILLLFLSIPVKEADDVPSNWFTIIYYVLMTFLAALAGILIAIVLMLQNAIGSLIKVIRPSAERKEKKIEKEQEEKEQNKEDTKTEE